MKNASLLIATLLLTTFLSPAVAQGTGTFTNLNADDPWLSWSCPRINNLGHVAMTKSVTTSYSGAAYLWTGSWATLKAFPGTYVETQPKQPKLELNDDNRIAFRTSGEGVRVADTTGIIPIGAPPYPLNYSIDINAGNEIAAFAYVGWLNSRIYTSDDPYSAFTEIAGPADIITFHIDLNDSGQVAWKGPGTSTMYRYTPGVGNEPIGSSDWAPFDMDNAGRIIHVRNQNKIMLGNMILRQSDDVWVNNNTYAQSRISDNGRYVIWTEYDPSGTGSDLWSMVDGIPTNITGGNYGWVYFPDVNNAGTVVFSEVVTGSNDADVWLYEPDDVQPIVYNGHFDGETLFGWEPVLEGSATTTLVADGSGGFAAELTSGSPAAIEQAVNVPSGAASLEIDIDFITANGTLTVTLGGVELSQITATDDTSSGFTKIEIPIDTTPPLGVSGAILSISLDDPAMATVQVDNIVIPEVTTDVAGGSGHPTSIRSVRATPNPFFSATTIHFGLDRPGILEASVYDIRGRQVNSLFDAYHGGTAGTLVWDGRDDSGRALSAGVYFVTIASGNRMESRKIHLVR